MGKSGIYCIRNVTNNKVYIGSAVDLDRRKYHHFNKLKKNAHKNSHLQAAYNKYGENSFEFEVIETVENIKLLQDREQHYIDNYSKDLYNQCPIAYNTTGRKHSDETKQKISAKLTGRKLSEDTKNKLRQYRIGTTHVTSEETKSKISSANKGKRRTAEAKDKIRKSHTGKKRTQQHRNNISKAKGKKIVQIDIETGNIINTYNSITEASESLNIDRTGISAACTGKQKSSGGFRWQYAGDS